MANLPPLSEHFPERRRASLRLENQVRIFHAECGGIVVGELGKPLTCAECGAEMTAFISAAEETEMRGSRVPLQAPVVKPKPICYKCGQLIKGLHALDLNGPSPFRAFHPPELGCPEEQTK